MRHPLSYPVFCWPVPLKIFMTYMNKLAATLLVAYVAARDGAFQLATTLSLAFVTTRNGALKLSSVVRAKPTPKGMILVTVSSGVSGDR